MGGRRSQETLHGGLGLHVLRFSLIAAAERAGCERIWSEDFSAGQEYFGVTVANPFN